MWAILQDGTRLLAFANVLVLSTVVILAFSLLAYHFTYSFRVSVARRFALLLACIMVVYASEVALTRVAGAEAAEQWLRFEWLGIAFVPAAYYTFSLAVLATTNFRVGRGRRAIAVALGIVSVLSAFDAIYGNSIVSGVEYTPLVAYLIAGPLIWGFAAFYAFAIALALFNVLKARSRCLTDNSRRRMNFLLLGFIAPAVGVFPYLVVLSRLWETGEPSRLLVALSILLNAAVAVLLIIMSYTVAYFGALTPDRVVRYRMVRFLLRGPAVAILVILAIQIVPTIERVLGLPRDVVLFSVITGVIVCSQLFLSVSKSLVDRLIYREDRDEVAWLRELDRHLLTTSDLRQFLENHLVALCELLRVRSGFVASVIGPDLILEAMVGPTEAREGVVANPGWSETLRRAFEPLEGGRTLRAPISESGYWLWPLQERSEEGDLTLTLGLLGVEARTTAPILAPDEIAVIDSIVERISSALVDRRVQQGVFVTLRTIIPDIERIQTMRTVVPYAEMEGETTTADSMLHPSPVESPEFEAWVKDALSHYWGGPKLTTSPLLGLHSVNHAMVRADDDPTKALRLVLGSALERLRPEGKQNFTAPEWLLYNILEMRFIQGRKVREIADRLAMSESDLYRKQRVAIGHLARVLTEMENEQAAHEASTAGNGAARPPAAPQPAAPQPAAPQPAPPQALASQMSPAPVIAPAAETGPPNAQASQPATQPTQVRQQGRGQQGRGRQACAQRPEGQPGRRCAPAAQARCRQGAQTGAAHPCSTRRGLCAAAHLAG